jgi:hypothetical protein
MKLYLCLAAVIGWTITASAMSEGPSTTGGNGYSVVCREKGKIVSAELLDLYEAQAKFHLSLPKPLGSLKRDYLRAVKNSYSLQGQADAFQENAILTNLYQFLDHLHFGGPVLATNDIGPTLPPPHGCKYEATAYFHDQQDVVDVDLEIWNALDSLSQAALVSHELDYSWNRVLQDRTSENARALVAYIYSNSDIVPVKADLPKTALLFGTYDANQASQVDSSFYVYPALEGVTLQLVQIMSLPMITKATVDVPGIHFALDHQCLVTEAATKVDAVFPVHGSQREDYALGIHYETGMPVRLTLFENGIATKTAEVDQCP